MLSNVTAMHMYHASMLIVACRGNEIYVNFLLFFLSSFWQLFQFSKSKDVTLQLSLLANQLKGGRKEGGRGVGSR